MMQNSHWKYIIFLNTIWINQDGVFIDPYSLKPKIKNQINTTTAEKEGYSSTMELSYLMTANNIIEKRLERLSLFYV